MSRCCRRVRRSGCSGGTVGSAAAEPTGKPLEIALDHIERNPYQTRTHFDEAQAGGVGGIDRGDGRGAADRGARDAGRTAAYQLITGERRWRASRQAGKATIPAIVRQVYDEQAMEMTIVENLQRADLNPMEQARAYRAAVDGVQADAGADGGGRARSARAVATSCVCCGCRKVCRRGWRTGELTFGHARALLALEAPEEITVAAQKMMALSLSVRQTELYVQGLINPEV